MESNEIKFLVDQNKLTVGKEYWVFIAVTNIKGTGLKRHLKPTLATCTHPTRLKSSNSKFEQTRYASQDLYYSGFAFETKEEAIIVYNKTLDHCAQKCKDWISSKYNKEYIKQVTDTILKHKII